MNRQERENDRLLKAYVDAGTLSVVTETNQQFRVRMKPEMFGAKRGRLVFEGADGRDRKCRLKKLHLTRNMECDRRMSELQPDVQEAMCKEISAEIKERFDEVISVIEQRRGIGEKYVFNHVNYYCKGHLKGDPT